MSVSALRALVLDVNMTAHGAPVTVTVAGSDPVETTAIWIDPRTEDTPAGMEFRRKDVVMVVALRRSEVPRVPRGTRIVGAPHFGDESKVWIVDGTEMEKVDRVYVAVTPE
jgi:hypothetical protein